MYPLEGAAELVLVLVLVLDAEEIGSSEEISDVDDEDGRADDSSDVLDDVVGVGLELRALEVGAALLV